MRCVVRRGRDLLAGGHGIGVVGGVVNPARDRQAEGERFLRLHLAADPRATGCCSRVDTDVLCRVAAPGGLQLDAELSRDRLREAEAVGGAVVDVGIRAGSARVTDDVQQLDAAVGRPQRALLHDRTGHVGGEHVRLNHIAFGLECYAHAAGRDGTDVLHVHIVHIQPDTAVLAVLVELVDGLRGRVVEAVAYHHVTAALRHTVQAAVLGVVVVVIVLVGRGLELVLASAVEDRIAQGINHLVAVVGIERHALLLVGMHAVDFHLGLAVSDAFQTVDILYQADLDRIMVDAVIDAVVVYAVAVADERLGRHFQLRQFTIVRVGHGVVAVDDLHHFFLLHHHLAGRGVVDGGIGYQRGVRQVDDLIALPCSEQRRIAGSGGLRHFVLDREQVHLVLACERVRCDEDTFLLGDHMRLAHDAFGLGALRVGAVHHVREAGVEGVA